MYIFKSISQEDFEDHTRLSIVTETNSQNSQLGQTSGIMDAIQRKGGCTATHISFTATVQRVLCKTNRQLLHIMPIFFVISLRELLTSQLNSQIAHSCISLLSHFHLILLFCIRDLPTSVNLDSTTNSYSLLLTDIYGGVCLLMLPHNAPNSSQWKEIITSGEGHQFHFSSLSVQCRSNRERYYMCCFVSIG